MNEKMKLREKLIFGFGDLFGGGAQSIIAVLYLIFLTDMVGLKPAIAGTVILVSKIWDGVIDPFIGVLTDNTRSRFGRRRPFILVGGLLLIIAFLLLWFPMTGGTQLTKALYVVFAYLFYNTVASIIAIPYSSLSTEISNDEQERNSVNIIRLVISTIAAAVCTLVPSIILGLYRDGSINLTTFYLILALGFGVLFAIPVILIGLFTKERTPISEEKSKLSLDMFKTPLKIKPFRQLLGMYLAQALSMDVLSNGIMYFAIYVISGGSSTIFLGIFIGVQLLMFPIINKIVNKISKSKIYYFGLPLALIGIICLSLYPSSWDIVGAYLCTAITAIGFAGAQLTSWIMFPDVVDASELKLKDRNSGSFSGLMTFSRNLGQAIVIQLFAIILQITGYVKPIIDETGKSINQPQTDIFLLGVRLTILIGFGSLITIGYFLGRRYLLTKDKAHEVYRLLELQRHNKLNKEDLSSYEEITKQF